MEGNSGTTTLDVPVTLSKPSTQTVTVDWETIDSLDQPEVGVDYESASGTGDLRARRDLRDRSFTCTATGSTRTPCTTPSGPV